MQAVIDHLKSHRAEHLEWTRDLCRIPSVSTRPEHAGDVRRSVEWTMDALNRIGVPSKVMETGGHPLVYGERIDHPGQPSYLVYGHVDVQPTGDLKLWDADPFEPVVKDNWLICRGSSDDKGQALLYVRAAAAWLATSDKLPINLKFLIEGEEEIGSPNLARFVQEHREMLSCKTILISDTGMLADGHPTLTWGTRGLVYKEVRLTGPRHDLHSGSHGGAAANPATLLAQLIASMHDAKGRVTIPGFYDQVAELSKDERAALNATFPDEQRYASELGVDELWTGEVGYTAAERRSVRPTLEVNGIYGGYQGEGANTIVPARAGAKISMRLVPHQPAAKISEAFDAAVRERLPKSVRVEILTHGPAVDAYMTPADLPEFRAARRALEETYGKPAAMLREGGSLPILPMIKRVLGADSLMLGFASPQCNAHGPNEKAFIPDLDRGAEVIARLFSHIASNKA